MGDGICVMCAVDAGVDNMSAGWKPVSVGLCDQCHADLRLGRMVRMLTGGQSLICYDHGWAVGDADMLRCIGEGDTPDAALEAAGKEKGK